MLVFFSIKKIKFLFILEMYKKDREKLKFDIQYDRINSELFEPLREYIQSLNDLIIALEEDL